LLRKKEGLTRRFRGTFLTLFFIVWPSIAFSLEGIVTQVKDGDTVVISPLSGEKSFTCRLYGIDSPERAYRGKRGQPYADEAGEVLKETVYKQQVSVTLTGEKSYRREICLIKKDSVDINREMVKRGYAWASGIILRDPMQASTLTLRTRPGQRS